MTEAYKDRHRGETCALLLNGESVREFEPNRWHDTVVGTNHACEPWLPVWSEYHFIIDLAQLEALVEEQYSVGILFVGVADETDRDKGFTEKKRALYDKVNAVDVREYHGWEGRRYPDFVTGCKRVWIPNVAVFALQGIAMLGFSRVEIWGLDLHGPKFWKADSDMSEVTRDVQNRQLKFVAQRMKQLDINVINRNPHSQCGAFRKGEK